MTIKRFAMAAAGAVLVSLASLVPLAAQDFRTTQVHFGGFTGQVLNGEITGRETVLYQLQAEAGEDLLIRLRPNNTSTYFNVYGPGNGPGDAAIATSDLTPELNVN